MTSSRAVFYVSDGTALTAEAMGAAVLSQYPIQWQRFVRPFIDTTDKAHKVRDLIDDTFRVTGVRPIVFFSIVRDDIRDEIVKSSGFSHDVLAALVKPLESELGVLPQSRLGRTHGLLGDNAKRYDARIAAIDYTLAHDDGVSLRHVESADVVLLGVSRCGKTPTSLYLAMQFGLPTLNYPFVTEDMDNLKLPKELESSRSHLFGLTIEPERLSRVREERRPNSRYASLRQCRMEVSEVEALYRRLAIPYLDTTNHSVEEIAATIISTLGLERRSF